MDPATTHDRPAGFTPPDGPAVFTPPPGPAVFITRGASAQAYHLITEADRAPSALPELRATTVTKLVTPRRPPARFAQYLLRIEPGGGTAPGCTPTRAGLEHFLYSGCASSAVLPQSFLADESEGAEYLL